jgi:hypothetical protein
MHLLGAADLLSLELQGVEKALAVLYDLGRVVSHMQPHVEGAVRSCTHATQAGRDPMLQNVPGKVSELSPPKIAMQMFQDKAHNSTSFIH